MANFAKLNENNEVINVIVLNNSELLVNGKESEDQGIKFLKEWSGGHENWKQCSYNNNFRKNYPAIGGKYDAELDAFINPSPYESWLFNKDTCRWYAPVPYPDDGKSYLWNEQLLNWEDVSDTIPDEI